MKALLIGALRLIRSSWLMLGAVLLCLALLDALLRLSLPEPDSALIQQGARAPARETMAANGPDAADYWREHEAARHTAWRPYVYFRRLPYQGRHIVVDAHGFRRTLPEPIDGSGEVWFFGGSSTWGTGVDDAETLPSLAARTWNSRADAPRVRNFAESGYVAMQGQLAFAQALRCPEPMPRLAVFVDGVNDVFAALQNGRAGWPQNEANRVSEFNLSRRADALAAAWLARLKGVHALRALLAPEKAPEPKQIETLAEELVRSYLAVVAQTRALATARGVPVAFVWQPSLFSKFPLAADEDAAYRASLSTHVALQRASNAALKNALALDPQPDVFDMSELFADSPEPLYFDYAHLGRVGNARLMAALLPELDARLGGLAGLDRVEESDCSERPAVAERSQLRTVSSN